MHAELSLAEISPAVRHDSFKHHCCRKYIHGGAIILLYCYSSSRKPPRCSILGPRCSFREIRYLSTWLRYPSTWRAEIHLRVNSLWSVEDPLNAACSFNYDSVLTFSKYRAKPLKHNKIIALLKRLSIPKHIMEHGVKRCGTKGEK